MVLPLSWFQLEEGHGDAETRRQMRNAAATRAFFPRVSASPGPRVSSQLRSRGDEPDNRPRHVPGLCTLGRACPRGRITDIMHDDVKPLGAADHNLVLLECVERVFGHLNRGLTTIAEPGGHPKVAEQA